MTIRCKFLGQIACFFGLMNLLFFLQTVEQSQGSGDTTNADASPTSPNSQDEDFSLEFASLFEAVAPTPPIQVQDSQAEVNAAQTEEPEGGEVREDGNKDDHVESEEKPAPVSSLNSTHPVLSTVLV